MPGSAFPSDERLVLSIDEAAARLGLHRQTVRAAIDRGDLRAVRVGRRWLVPIDAVVDLLGTDWSEVRSVGDADGTA